MPLNRAAVQCASIDEGGREASGARSLILVGGEDSTRAEVVSLKASAIQHRWG